ncbi:MAG: HEAT repeat domain-containing protein, partial [Promethearchaeota archaeon]
MNSDSENIIKKSAIIKKTPVKKGKPIVDPKAKKIQKKNIKGLIKTLKREDKETHIVAKRALVAFGEDAVEALLDLLKNDRNKKLQGAAADVLGMIRSRRAIYDLTQALSDEYEGLRISAGRALGLIGDASAAFGLIQSLRDENRKVRSIVAKSLNILLDIKLRDQLSTSDPRSLRKIGDNNTIQMLIKSLDDESFKVRRKASDVIKKFYDPMMVDKILSKKEREQKSLEKLIELLLSNN